MACKKNRPVIIKVDRKWFENIFEKQRKKAEKQMNMRISQVKLTKLDLINKNLFKKYGKKKLI